MQYQIFRGTYVMIKMVRIVRKIKKRGFYFHELRLSSLSLHNEIITSFSEFFEISPQYSDVCYI